MARGRLASRLTYGDFYRTGVQDCGNTLSINEFELDRDKTPEQIVDAEIDNWEMSDWMSSQDDDTFEDLDPQQCYAEWKAGWRSCAISSITQALEEKKQRDLDDLELFYVYSERDGEEVLVEHFDDLQNALDMLTRLPSGVIRHGDGNGPDYTMFATDPASDELAVIRAPGQRTLQGRKLPAIEREFSRDRKAARSRDFRANPAINAEDVEAAAGKYKEFHRYDHRRLDELGELEIPTRVRQLGAAKHVLYQSAKVDPSTLRKPKKPVSYIHEHDAGVMVYAIDGELDTDVPKEFTSVTALVKLGKCLGFALHDGTEAEGTDPLPDLACTPDGKCLLVIQDKKEVLAMFWGGALGVFARGIDG